ncbi:MAG: hypothetical protein ACRDTC_02315, partial [Pseudonocardiaceae bacterium]
FVEFPTFLGIASHPPGVVVSGTGGAGHRSPIRGPAGWPAGEVGGRHRPQPRATAQVDVSWVGGGIVPPGMVASRAWLTTRLSPPQDSTGRTRFRRFPVSAERARDVTIPFIVSKSPRRGSSPTTTPRPLFRARSSSAVRG